MSNEATSTDPTAPDTIVLIHGFWVTPRSWEDWIKHYETKGYKVIAPAYPGFEVEVEALNADPSPIEAVTVPQIIGHLEEVVGEPRQATDSDRPFRRRRLHPDPVGSRLRRGRRRDQLGADRGRPGHPAVPGEIDVPGTQEPGEPAPRSRFHARAVDATHSPTPSATSSRRRRTSGITFPRPAIFSGEPRWPTSPRAIRTTGSTTTTTSGRRCSSFPARQDHLMPPSIQRSNAKHYKSATITEIKEFAGPHLLPSQEGWEQVADYALDWAVAHIAGTRRRSSPGAVRWATRRRAVTDVGITHIGGPTVLIEFDGWRLLTDPTFDAPGRRYTFGWGSASRKGPGRRSPPRRSGRSTRCCSAMTTTRTTSTTPGAHCYPPRAVVVTTLRCETAGRQRTRARTLVDNTPRDGREARPSRSPQHPAGTDQPAAGRSPETSSDLRCGGPVSTTAHCGYPATRCSTTGCGTSPTGSTSAPCCCTWVAVRFGVTGPVRYSMTAREGVELLGLLRPTTAIPVHYEGWTHFRQNRTAIEAEFAGAPRQIRDSITWAPIGEPISGAGLRGGISSARRDRRG